jgi:rod shape-determining protein MreC
MKWISNLVSGYVRTANIVVVCLVSVLVTLGGPPVATLVGGTLQTIFYYPFAKLRITVVHLIGEAEQSDDLQLALREATLELSNIAEVRRENQRLHSVLNFEPPPSYSLLQARVISMSGATAPVSAVINRGSRSGVAPGMPIINQHGLIGRVVSVFENVATVELLTDPGHRVAARVAETREMGIVKYHPWEGMVLDNFPAEGKIAEGNEVISSGLGGTYPAGLLIGTVRSAERMEDQPFCRVMLEPAVNFNTIEELFILMERR